jgi:hypothetical protein
VSRRKWKPGRCGVCYEAKAPCPKCGAPVCPVDKQFHAERECRTSSDLTALNKRQAKEGVERLRADLKTLGEIKGDGITK